MNDPTRDARTVIARRVKSLSQLRPEYVADELLAALDDAGFAVAARPVVPTNQSDIEGLASFLRPALNEDQTGQHFSHGSEDTATAIARYLDNNGWHFAHRSGATGIASTGGDSQSPLGANPAGRVEQQQPTDAREVLYAIAESAYDVERCRPNPEPYPEWIAAAVDAVVAALGTTHPTRCQSCGWAWQHDNPPPATCPHCRAAFAADQEDTAPRADIPYFRADDRPSALPGGEVLRQAWADQEDTDASNNQNKRRRER